MNRRKILFPILIVLSLLAVAGSGYAGVAFAMSNLAGPTPSVMSYQGYLTDSLGMPITGAPDFDFRIWDNNVGGSQVWSEVQNNVPVTNGYFSVMLGSVNALQASHFSGPRYLEVRVDTGGGWTTLPRQQLGAVPFAYQAEQASAALSVPWSGITSRPAGLDDGDNDTLYTAGNGLVLVGNQFRAEGSPYQQVIVVAQSGGDFTSIQAALDSITGAPNNRYLIWIAPGMYQERVTMEPFVDLMGAGENQTVIFYPGSSNPTDATVKGASNATLSLMTIQSSGGDYAKAVYNYNASPTLRHVTLLAASSESVTIGMYNQGTMPGTNSIPILEDVSITVSQDYGDNVFVYGVYNYDVAYPVLHNVDIMLLNGGTGCGIYNTSSSSINISDSIITTQNLTATTGIQTANAWSYIDNVNMVINGISNAVGISNPNANVDIHNLHLTVNASQIAGGILNGFTSTGPQEWFDSTVIVNPDNPLGNATGILNYPVNKLILNRFEIQVGGESSNGVFNQDGSLNINRTSIVSHGMVNSYGVYTVHGGAPTTVAVINSLIQAATSTFYAIAPGPVPGIVLRIGGTHLSGGPVLSPAVVICAGVYDENFSFFAGPACP